MQNMQKSDWKLNFPCVGYGYRKCVRVFWFLKLDTHVSSQVCVTVECRVVFNSWRRNPIYFKHASLWCWLFDAEWTTYQSQYRGRLSKDDCEGNKPILCTFMSWSRMESPTEAPWSKEHNKHKMTLTSVTDLCQTTPDPSTQGQAIKEKLNHIRVTRLKTPPPPKL